MTTQSKLRPLLPQSPFNELAPPRKIIFRSHPISAALFHHLRWETHRCASHAMFHIGREDSHLLFKSQSSLEEPFSSAISLLFIFHPPAANRLNDSFITEVEDESEKHVVEHIRRLLFLRQLVDWLCKYYALCVAVDGNKNFPRNIYKVISEKTAQVTQ